MMYDSVHATAYVWRSKDNFHFSVGSGDCMEVTKVCMVSVLTTSHWKSSKGALIPGREACSAPNSH